MKQIFLLFLILAVTSAYNKLELPYQAHSMNDLDLTLQELIKGVNNFKFDVSVATQESCENHSTWNKNYQQCGYYGGFGMKTCCLALRGDCSQQPVFNYSFNTTTDMVSMISNPKYAFIFSKNTTTKKYQQTKYFAFNFQYSYDQDQMTIDFIYGFLKAIQDYDLNLRMVTGSGWLINYFDNKCIVQQNCTEKEQFISQSDIILQSPYSGPRERTIQFNQETTVLPEVCSSGFPSYMKNNSIPFQFWEPSYQDSIYDVYDQFWSQRCLKLGIKDPVQRFKITSNLNSENYATFLQRTNTTSDSTYVPPKYRFQNQSSSLIEYNNQHGITFLSKKNEITNIYEISIYDNVSFDKSIDSIQFDQAITKLSSKGSYLQVETDQQISVYNIQQNKQLKLVKTISKLESTYICSDILLINEKDPYVSISYLTSSSLLKVKIVSVDNGQTLLEIEQQVNNVQPQGFNYVSSIFYEGKVIQIYTYESVNPSNNVNEISFFYHTIELKSQKSVILQPQSPQNFGSNSSLKIENYNGNLYFIQVSANGSAWSGVFINNGDWAKCDLYKLDKFVNLRNIPHTITYMWGRVEDLVERIQSSTFINSCDKKIISSKIYNGGNPQITVRRDSQNKPTAYVSLDYTRYDELPLLTTLFLGSNSYEPEFADDVDLKMIEVISFDLLEYEIFNIAY
ncbi:hypothetical protein TTHERM_01099190 (macronuclear) [Tetrahymena thermophila SB210]|uniref:Transmembrane protein n=1 Tax=Tetrahymena thermophila (strain SB210) TaxID=312017 RepID=Q22BJ4_TETTS|nr:hypothetical protein TTHERM_01099190 [Tetrahymena thermophila SB210]EAR82672.2 hypothetical protein TTHERM_01099190 [Tetrahymena thermophila SB210]|eukprot:XP_001030335.2 hypothetical protein TTHERM_01099190 [Tetrahymena thermophila SB210]